MPLLLKLFLLIMAYHELLGLMSLLLFSSLSTHLDILIIFVKYDLKFQVKMTNELSRCTTTTHTRALEEASSMAIRVDRSGFV